MQRAVVAAREENIHEVNLRRERQNFEGPRHRIVQMCMETTLMLENSYKQVQFLDGITQRLTQSEIWLSVYLVSAVGGLHFV